MLTNFIGYLTFEKRYSQHTIGAYENDLVQFIDFAGIKNIEDFRELNTPTIRGWIVELFDKKNKAKSINRKLAALRTLFKWLRKEGIVFTNPMTNIQGPKNENDYQHLQRNLSCILRN